MTTPSTPTADPASKSMDDLVALCKRRGFVFQSSDIHGGVNGFWDYGPLGVELKRNVREAWYRDMITLHDEFAVPPGAPQAFQMTSVETCVGIGDHGVAVYEHGHLSEAIHCQESILLVLPGSEIHVHQFGIEAQQRQQQLRTVRDDSPLVAKLRL